MDPVPAEQDFERIAETVSDEKGVDLTQIDMMLRLMPRERLQALYVTASSLARLMTDANPD